MSRSEASRLFSATSRRNTDRIRRTGATSHSSSKFHRFNSGGRESFLGCYLTGGAVAAGLPVRSEPPRLWEDQAHTAFVFNRVERFDRRGTEPFEPFEPFEFFQNRNFPEFFLRKFKNFRKIIISTYSKLSAKFRQNFIKI